MFNIEDEKDKLTKELSEQYARNAISMEEYERILEYVHKIETKKEAGIIEKIIRENNTEDDALTTLQNDAIMPPQENEKHLSMFSWRTTTVRPIKGSAGTFISLFGTNRIIVDDLPKGRTVLRVHSIFGLTEILVAKNIRIVNKAAPIFSGIFSPGEANRESEALPELYIVGKAVFGNITVKTMDEFKKEAEQEKAFEEKVKEKILKKIYDKI